MSRTILLVLAFFALILSVSAHAGHTRRSNTPYGYRKRDVQASTCSYMQCAVKDGNCGMSGTSLTFCADSQHCSGNKCTNDIALGSKCNLNAQENECAQGTCVDNGSGSATCQIFQQTLPGNPCTSNDQCYFSESADGSGSVASTCSNGICAGKMIGQTCSYSHQCFVGSFCSAGTCKALGQSGASCITESECGSRFTCLDSVCTSRYSRTSGQSCSSTDHCASGTYCKSGTCSAVKSTSASAAKCDVSSNSCGNDEECACQGFTTPSQTATCSNIKGTAVNMATIEQTAYTCIDRHACGSDFDNTTTISCVKNNCMKEYCTYFTRSSGDLLNDYPTCLLSRMVESSEYYNLLNSCRVYFGNGPSTSTTGMSSASSTSLSFALAALVVVAAFLF